MLRPWATHCFSYEFQPLGMSVLSKMDENGVWFHLLLAKTDENSGRFRLFLMKTSENGGRVRLFLMKTMGEFACF